MGLKRKIQKDLEKEAEDYEAKQYRKKLIIMIIIVLIINISYNVLSSRAHQQNTVDEVSQIGLLVETAITFIKSFLSELGFK